MRFVLSVFFILFLNQLHGQRTLFMCQTDCDADQNCRYILLDTSGKKFLPDTAGYCTRWINHILLETGNFWSMYNENGKMILDSLEDFSWLSGSWFLASKRGKWGYYSTDLRLKIPHQYAEASDFYDGVALVKKGTKYHYIDTNGKALSSVSADVKSHFNRFGTQHYVVPKIEMEFSHDLYEVFPEEPYYAKKGIREIRTGKIILENLFDEISSNNDDYVIVGIGGKEGVFCLSKGIWVIQCLYRDIDFLD